MPRKKLEVARLSKTKKVALLKSIGTKPENIKMIIELDEKIKKLKAKDPGATAAWGLGCGGVTC